MKVRVGGPWVVSGQVLAIESCREGFLLSKDSMSRTAA